jgi:hypothetical protein
MALLPGQVLVKSTLAERPEYANAIGTISIELANLEIELGNLFGALLHVDKYFGRLVYLTPNSYQARLHMLENVTAATFDEETAERKHLKTIITKARAYIGQRHNLVHDAWGTHKDDSTKIARQALPIKEKDQATIVPIETLTDLIRKIQALTYVVIKTQEASYQSWPPYTWQEKSPQLLPDDPYQALPNGPSSEDPEPQFQGGSSQG